MATVKIDLDKLQNEDGLFSESDTKKIEELTGKPWQEIYKEATAEEPPEVKSGDPTKWPRSEKLSFIKEHGREKYQQLVRERT